MRFLLAFSHDGLWLSAEMDGSVHVVARRGVATRFWPEPLEEQPEISGGQVLVFLKFWHYLYALSHYSEQQTRRQTENITS